MEHKNIVATIYLKNGQAVKGMDNFEPMGWDVISLARLYNDSGIDKIIIFDLSEDDEEHEKNIQTIKNINRNVEIKVCAGGNISRFEDVKKFIYAGCLQVIVNGAKSNSMDIAREASDTASEGTGQINQLQAEFTDASKTMYDGTEVSGSEVLNVIRKFSDETMGILVQTNKNKTYYNYNFDVDKGELGKALDNSYKNAQDVASDKYINPTALVQGSIVKDVNGTIIGIVFAQV